MYLTDTSPMEELKNVDKSKFEEYFEQFGDWLVSKAFDLLIAFLFLFIGTKIIKLIIKIIKHSFDKTGMETSVSGFLLSFIKGVLYFIVIIMSASILGIQVTSLVAISGTAGLAIGLALQGSLANFAGGVLILIMKPFKVGDFIIENDKGCQGTVESIDIFYTKLRTYDNKIIVIPNGNITSHSLVNVTSSGSRKLDISVSVSYESNIKQVKAVLEALMQNSEYCDKTKAMEVFVDEFLDSGMKICMRCFVKTEDYWKAKWELMEQMKEAFDENGIIIPYPHMDVSVKEHKNIE